MALQRNLLFAEEAIKYVESILRGKSSNRPEDTVHQLQQMLGGDKYQKLLDVVPKDKMTGKSDVLELIVRDVGDEYHVKKVEPGRTLNPEKIKQRGIGNC